MYPLDEVCIAHKKVRKRNFLLKGYPDGDTLYYFSYRYTGTFYRHSKKVFEDEFFNDYKIKCTVCLGRFYPY